MANLDDSSLYTGVDNDPQANGVFDNEIQDEEVRDKIQEQEQLDRESLPKLQGLIDVIDSEIASVMSIDRFITAAKESKENINAELQAAALYKNYLGILKTKFKSVLEESGK